VATPLNPLPLSDAELVARLLKRYPGLTAAAVLDLARAHGFDLTVPTSATSSSPARPPSKRRQ
jgi:hypothetical protein